MCLNCCIGAFVVPIHKDVHAFMKVTCQQSVKDQKSIKNAKNENIGTLFTAFGTKKWAWKSYLPESDTPSRVHTHTDTHTHEGLPEGG